MADEITIVSEAGFTKAVLQHVKTLHRDTIRLGKLHVTDTGLIERFNSTCLGVVHMLSNWWFAAILVQFADNSDIDFVPIDQNFDYETKLFGCSPMDLIRHAEAEHGSFRPGKARLCIPFNGGRYNNRPIKQVIIVAEKENKIWEPKTRFYAYSGVYPEVGQRGIAIISEFKFDLSRNGRLTLVVVPDPDNLSGNQANIAGQFEFV